MLLSAVVENSEYKPYTNEYACAFEVVIYLHEKKPEKAFEIAHTLANSGTADVFTIQSQVALLCGECGFREEWKRLFVRQA